MNETVERLRAATEARRRKKLTKLLDSLFEAKQEMDNIDRRKDVIMEEAFERLSEFAVDRMSKKDMASLSALYRRLPPEFKVWLDKTREIYELSTGTKLEE